MMDNEKNNASANSYYITIGDGGVPWENSPDRWGSVTSVSAATDGKSMEFWDIYDSICRQFDKWAMKARDFGEVLWLDGIYPEESFIVFRVTDGDRYGMDYTSDGNKVKFSGEPYKVVIEIVKEQSMEAKATDEMDTEEVMEEREAQKESQEETKSVPAGNAVEEFEGNALKAVSWDDDWIRVKNYIILFGDEETRDLEGVASPRLNEDGSKGEFFTKSTEYESTYTAIGRLPMDFEHGQKIDGPEAPGRDDIVGYVDWSTKHVDEKGVLVERALNRRHWYIKMLEENGMFELPILGTSSEPVQSGVRKSVNGAIEKWPLKRDSLTFTPMEPRMLSENAVTAIKAAAEKSSVVLAYAKSIGLIAEESSEDTEGDVEGQEEARETARAAARAKAIAKAKEMEIKFLLEDKNEL